MYFNVKGTFPFARARLKKVIIDAKYPHRRKKVFAIGFNKTGTTSLHQTFLEMGLTSYHGPNWHACDDERLLRSWHCFSDAAPRNFARLDVLFPQAKFILNVRDLESWLISRIRHIRKYEAEGRHRPSAGWDVTADAIRSWVISRNLHHTMVQYYFSHRPDDLLIINYIRDPMASEKVSNFLGFDGIFPKAKANASETTNAFKQGDRDLVDAVISELRLSKNDLTSDLLCENLNRNMHKIKIHTDTKYI